MLCNVCIDALVHRKGWSRIDGIGYRPYIHLAHHASISSLESSALSACEICRPFWRKLSHDDQRRLREFDVAWSFRQDIPKSIAPGQRLKTLDEFVTSCLITNHQEDDSKPLGMGLTLGLKFESKFLDSAPLRSGNLRNMFYLRRGAAKDLIQMTPFLSSSTGSEEALAKASTWIQTCTSTHQTCNVEMKSHPWYPTRLLDISADTFRIIMTAETPPSHNERYATLSHCWGSAQFLQLKRSTVKDLKSGIPITHLPKTFREAIQVTRHLGLHLLWIDSLCIFQDRDDLSDWLVEAGLMHKVYAHSFCNISAAGASDSTKGLFFERDPRISATSEVRFCSGDLGVGSDYVDIRIENSGFWTDDVNECPLNKRGWVLQERFISPRVLHFAHDQLFWECREHNAAESYPDGLPQVVQSKIGVKMKRLDRAAYGSGPGMDAQDPMFYYETWNQVVRMYSGARLTKSGDKLIALSGIAKRYAALMDDEYVVGMWRRYLVSQLVWFISECSQADGSPSVRPQPYRAPSFSWASVDGLMFGAPSTDVGMLIEVVDLHLDYVTDDATGLVKGGHLDLKGRLRPFEMAVQYADTQQQLLMRVGGVLVRDSDKSDFEAGPLIMLDVSQERFDLENEDGMLFYVPTREQADLGDYVNYLLLCSVDKSAGTFRRIGIVSTGSAEEIQMLDWAACPVGQDLPCLGFADGLHTIRII
ncbi:hypothetical protein ACJZ2D_006274 [Fusarium nematophilum]